MNNNILVITEERLKLLLEEAVCSAIDKYRDQPSNTQPDTEALGDLNWLYTVYPSSISRATIKHKSATGQIPGKIKVLKRVMYDKATVIEWFKANATKIKQTNQLKQSVNEQFDNQLNKLTNLKKRKV